MHAISNLGTLLGKMQPVLNPGRYAFIALPAGLRLDPDLLVASIREPEGLSVVLPEQVALDHGLLVAFTSAWITLAVHSSLAAIGLTAAVSKALGEAGISCNVVAGTHHDHLFVPVEQAEMAMAVLRALQQSSAA